MQQVCRLFGTDGIRAIAGEYPLDDTTINIVGRAAAQVLFTEYGTATIVMGYDTRASSKPIACILQNCFLQAGYTIFNVGMFPTPGVAHIGKTYNCPGVVVSASHNTSEWNGIKFLSPQGTKIPEDVERKIEQAVVKKQDVMTSKRGKVIDIEKEGAKQYIELLMRKAPKGKIDLVFTIDCANGSTSAIAEKLFPQISPRCMLVHHHPDGKNINRQCGAIHPQNLSIQRGSCGMALDGDGDRIILRDENGVVRDGDYILGIVARYYQRKGWLKNNTVALTVMSNLGLLQYLKKQKIKTVLSPVGDKQVYEKMIEADAIVGGEQSGHIILLDELPTGDGMLVALLLLSIMQEEKCRLADLCTIFTPYPQILRNIRTNREPPLQEVYDQNILNTIEKEVEGRILIRYSGTEPLLRIMVEGRDRNKIEQAAEKLHQLFITYMQQYYG